MVIKTDHMAYLRSMGEASSFEGNPYSWAFRRIRALEAELAVRDNMGDEVLRILREATGKRDFYSEMEAAEWAAKMLADARLDSARLDHVIDNFEEVNFDGWYDHFDFNAVDTSDDGNEAHRIEHRKAWRKYLDAEMKVPQ